MSKSRPRVEASICAARSSLYSPASSSVTPKPCHSDKYPCTVSSLGIASPIEDATSLWGSLVEFLARTRNTISPALSIGMPWSLLICLHPGGMMLDTVTRLKALIPASFSATSKEARLSLCLPTPFVRKKYRGTCPKTVACRAVGGVV